ncbi:unnamed protein product [Closterium sp. NIES-53]
MATITVLRQRQPSVQKSLSPQHLRVWAIWWGSPGGGDSRARRRKPLSPQQRREWAVRWGSPSGGAWGATTRGTCESTPAGSATGRCGGFRSTRIGGVEAPGAVDAASLGAFDSPSTGAENEEALHTFTLDSGASRCFFRDSTTVTPLTVPVPVTLADPFEGPVVAGSATILPCPAAPSVLLTGLHLPSFAKNLVVTSVLQDQWVTITQPGGELVAICTDLCTGEHLATFNRRPGSCLYTLTTESALVAESGQIAASAEVAASCSCRLLTHQTLLWHHRLVHPSLPCLRGMHSRLLVSDLPRSLPPLPRSLAPPCLPCVEGRQRAALQSSSFPPTTAPLQTLHMDVKADVHGVLICWIRAVCLQLRTRFREDLPVLRLHSDRGDEFCTHLLEDFCVMEAARTSMIHVVAPHFLWPFAVRYTAEKLSLWPRVSHPETSPTLQWMGEVGDASAFSVALPSLSLVDAPPHVAPLPPPGPTPSGVSQVDPPTLVEPFEVSSDTTGPTKGGDQTAADTVAPRHSVRLAVPPGFPPRQSSPPLWPVAVDSSVARGGDTRGAESGGAGSGGAVSPTGAGGAGGSAGGGAGGVGAGGAGAGGFGGAGPRGASAGVPGVGCAGGRGAGGTGATGGTGGAAAVGAAAGSPGSRRQEPLSSERLREWAVRWGSPGGGAGHAGAAGSGGAGPGGASAGVPRVGRAGGRGARGTTATGGTRGAAAVGAAAGTGRTGAAGYGGAIPRGASAGDPRVGRAGGIGTGGTCATGGTGGAGPVGASAVVPRVGGTGGADTGGAIEGTGFGGASRQESLSLQQLRAWAVRWGSPGGGAEVLVLGVLFLLGLERREPETRAFTPVRGRRVVHPRAPAVPGTHRMALRPSLVPQRVVLLSPPASSLPHVPDPEPDLVRIASPTVTRLLAKVVIDPSFESAAASALVAELVDFADLCRLDYDASLVFYYSYPPSVEGELALGCDVLEDKQFELEVKRPPGSPPTFKVRYFAQGFRQREGVDFFQTFSPTPKITTLRVLLHVAAQHDYELHSLDFLTAFLQGSLHEAIWLRHTSLPPFYVLVYVNDLVFATADMEALALVKAELQERHTCTDMGELRSYLGLQITRDRAHRTITSLSHTWCSRSFSALTSCGPCHNPLLCLPATRSQLHLRTSPTLGMGLVLGGRGSVVLTGHSDASLADDQTTHRSRQSCVAEIYAGAMAAQELCWLTYPLTDLGEWPHSPPVLYVDNKAMIALCQDQRLEHRTKHIALRYFLTRELEHRGQLCLAYVATQASIADVFTKALGSSDHQRFCTALGLVHTLPHLIVS